MEKFTTNAPMLEPRQKRFCDEYLIDLNAAAAARRAGYSVKNARVAGHRILALPQAKEYIQKGQEKITEELGNAASLMTRELVGLAAVKLGDFLDENGDIKNMIDLPDHLHTALQVQTKKVKVVGDVTTITTLNLYNKIQMMEKLTKRLDPKVDKADVTLKNRTVVTAKLGDGTIVEI